MKHKGKILIGIGVIAISGVLLFVSQSSHTHGPDITIVDQGINMSKTPEAKQIVKEPDGHIDMK